MVLAIGKNGPQSFWSPNLDLGPELKKCTIRPFHSWWNRPVMKDNHGAFFSRQALVLGVADQDGGAHVDRELDEACGELTRRSSIGWRYAGERGPEDIPGLELACVRQVAHELLVTPACQAPHAFPTQEEAVVHSSRLLEKKGALRVVEVGGVRPPFASLPHERLGDGALKGVARNAPCPCGSGQRYKQCHGL